MHTLQCTRQLQFVRLRFEYVYFIVEPEVFITFSGRCTEVHFNYASLKAMSALYDDATSTSRRIVNQKLYTRGEVGSGIHVDTVPRMNIVRDQSTLCLGRLNV